ncbi:MAG: (Fe-S)-binding protein, partial [Myxococcales bacterium]|nr:(Fe-S)-binding protein [Myxococcales bacterium]
VLHWVQAVEGRLPEPTAPVLSGDALYLDSCRLGRGLGVYDAPRRLLAALLGGQVREAIMHREEGGCCGAEAGYAALDHSGPGRVAQDAVADAPDLPVVIADPTCAAHLAPHTGRRVYPLARLLARALVARAPHPEKHLEEPVP